MLCEHTGLRVLLCLIQDGSEQHRKEHHKAGDQDACEYGDVVRDVLEDDSQTEPEHYRHLCVELESLLALVTLKVTPQEFQRRQTYHTQQHEIVYQSQYGKDY